MNANETEGKCPRCGDPNPPTAVVCAGCGARLPWAATAKAPANPVEEVLSALGDTPPETLASGTTAPKKAECYCEYCATAMTYAMANCPYCGKKNTRTKPVRRASALRLSALGIFLIILAASTWPLYQRWTRTPQYSLQQMQKAYAAQDLNAFEKYVDIESCASQFFSDVSPRHNGEAPTPEQAASEKTLTEAVKVLGKGLPDSDAVSALAAQIRAVAGKPAAEDEQDVKQDAKHDDNAIENGLTLAREKGIVYGGIEYVNIAGNTALVGLKFVNQKDAGKSFPLELKMVRKSDFWQVVSLSKFQSGLEILAETAPGTPVEGGATPAPSSTPAADGSTPQPEPGSGTPAPAGAPAPSATPAAAATPSAANNATLPQEPVAAASSPTPSPTPPEAPPVPT